VSGAEIRINDAAVQKMLRNPKGQVAKGILKIGKKVERKAKRLVPVDHGVLRNSISTELIIRRGPVARIGTKVKYALYVHEGTGIYGPKNSPIIARPGKVMAFTLRKSGKLIFTKKIKGMKGTPYLRNALISVVGAM
jgi:phage gpG-like protein